MGDKIGLSRFSGTSAPKGRIPQSAQLYSDCNDYIVERSNCDKAIITWTKDLEDNWVRFHLTNQH